MTNLVLLETLIKSDSGISALSIVKIISAVAAGAFALFGILGETRDNEQRLTEWGKIAIVGIVSSLALGLISQYLEDKVNTAKDNEEADVRLETAKRLEKIILQGDKSNKSLEMTNIKQKQALDSLRVAINLMDSSSTKENVIIRSTLQLNRELKASAEKHRLLIAEQAGTRNDLYKMMTPIKKWVTYLRLVHYIDNKNSITPNLMYDGALVGYTDRLRMMVNEIAQKNGGFPAAVPILSKEGVNLYLDKQGNITQLFITPSASKQWYADTIAERNASLALNAINIVLEFSKNTGSHPKDNPKSHYFAQLFCINNNSKPAKPKNPPFMQSWYQIDAPIPEGEFSFYIDYKKRTIEQSVTVNSPIKLHGLSMPDNIWEMPGSNVDVSVCNNIPNKYAALAFVIFQFNDVSNTTFEAYASDIKYIPEPYEQRTRWHFKLPERKNQD